MKPTRFACKYTIVHVVVTLFMALVGAGKVSVACHLAEVVLPYVRGVHCIKHQRDIIHAHIIIIHQQRKCSLYIVPRCSLIHPATGCKSNIKLTHSKIYMKFQVHIVWIIKISFVKDFKSCNKYLS